MSTISLNKRGAFSAASAGVWGRVFFAALAVVAGPISSGRAQVVLAPGDNSSITINPTGGGVTDWTINGDNILNPAMGGLQWSYYSSSVNPGAAPTGIQNGIGAVSSFVTISGDVASLNTTYGTGSNPFSLQSVYTLTGGPAGSANSDLTEIIDVKNNQASSLVFHLFQYADFTLPNPNVLLSTQTFRGTSLYTLGEVSGGPVSASEYVDATLNPGANEGTITPSLLALISTPGYQLTGAPATTNGPGGAWLVEWDVNIPVNGSFILSEDINASGFASAPEPAATSLVAGLIALGAFGIHRRRSAS